MVGFLISEPKQSPLNVFFLMIKKISLLIRTVKYLKIRQIIFQIYYRLKPIKALAYYEKKNINFSPVKFTNHYNTTSAYNGNNIFIFLNQQKQFGDKINWNFKGYGKLWSYNLQYCNFLHQNDISKDVKQNWLIDIGVWLENKNLLLEPYPVALRTMNTIRYINTSQVKNDKINRDLYAQLNYLSQHFEYHLLGNHLLENAFALLMGGCAFNESRWIEKSKSVLYAELEEQILSDGGHYELSPMYHQIILFRILELIDWFSKIKNPDLKFLDYLQTKADIMLNWLKAVSFKNGDIPFLNDSAPDVVFTSEQLFAFAEKLNLSKPKEIRLNKSGYRKFGNACYEFIVDAGVIEASYQPGHTHADIFSFALYYKNDPIIVEVGTSTYEKGERRNYERGTNAHNTVEIENANQFEVWDSFKVGARATVEITNETSSSISAFHNGYKKLYNAIHERSFDFQPESITVLDTIKSEKKVNARSYIHFHPDCYVVKKNEIFFINNTMEIAFVNATQLDFQTYKFALGYNLYKDARVLIIEFSNNLKMQIEFK